MVKTRLGTRWHSIERQLPLLIAGLLLVTVFAFAWGAYQRVKHVLLTAAGQRLQGMSLTLDLLFADAARRYVARVDSVASDPAIAAYLRHRPIRRRHQATTRRCVARRSRPARPDRVDPSRWASRPRHLPRRPDPPIGVGQPDRSHRRSGCRKAARQPVPRERRFDVLGSHCPGARARLRRERHPRRLRRRHAHHRVCRRPALHHHAGWQGGPRPDRSPRRDAHRITR